MIPKKGVPEHTRKMRLASTFPTSTSVGAAYS
jgi:hypothetical protein